ncbi:MAG: PEGA domain-containing protein [Proteobacteria bacterium]|nr:PEGA domain-containing protein [Pseudomonadota bacterium]
MKLNRIAGMALAGLCLLYSANASAESVAVMKLDVVGNNVDKQADYLLNAIRKQVEDSTYTLDANGSDITYTEMQMVTGCDREASIACYDAACETLGSPAVIFGTVKDNGEAHLIWYISGKGIFREATGMLSNKAAADALAKQIVIGEMGKLIVTSNIPGADIFIDGKRVGMSAEFEENAEPIELVTGNYVVAVRKDGYSKEDAVKVTIDSHEVAKVHVDMTVARDPEDTKRAVLIAGYTSFGVGAAALIAGGVIGAFVKFVWPDDLDKALTTKNSIESKYSDHGAYHKYGIAATSLLGIGGFFAAAGLALIITGYAYDFAGEDVDKAYSNKFMPKVDFNLSPEYQGMTMGWTF